MAKNKFPFTTAITASTNTNAPAINTIRLGGSRDCSRCRTVLSFVVSG